MHKKLLSAMTCVTIFALACSFLSCDKDPEIIIQEKIVTVHDTVTVTDTFTVIETIIQTIPDTATTFILVRHAETTGGGSNPSLSASGQTRAQELQRILDEIPLDAVYSTNFNRTMQTAQPIASAKSLTVQQYDPFAPDQLVDQALESYKDGFVLIVGHSNTTPAFVNTLVGENIYSDLPETEYDNLFLVYVSEKGRAKVVHMKYGE